MATAEEKVLPGSRRPANSEGPSHRSMLSVTIDLGLHAHEVVKNFRVRGVIKWPVLSNSCSHVFVDSSSQL